MPRKKLIEVALPPRRDQQGLGAGEVDPPRASVDASSVVGAAATCGSAGGDLFADGGRPFGVRRRAAEGPEDATQGGERAEGAAEGVGGGEGDGGAGRPRQRRGALAYAEAVGVYLALGVDRLSDRSSTICGWDSGFTKIRNTFGRQALPMSWDYAETRTRAAAASRRRPTA